MVSALYDSPRTQESRPAAEDRSRGSVVTRAGAVVAPDENPGARRSASSHTPLPTAYGSGRPLDAAAVHRWQPIVALVRLTADIPPEREPLLAIIRAALSDPKP